MARHERGDIDGALTEARRALDLAPDYADALSYLGSTLITRKASYTDGLAELERARDAAPGDAAVLYTLGWCYEFVAYRLSRRTEVELDPQELWGKAEGYLRRCLEMNPQGKLKDDAQDLLSTITKEDVG